MAHLAHDRLKVPDGHGERRWAPSKVVGAEDNDPPVILPGGQGEGAGDEVRGQEVMRHGETGDALGQGEALGQGNGAPKGLRLGIKGRKGSRRRRGVLAAAGQDKQNNRKNCPPDHFGVAKAFYTIALLRRRLPDPAPMVEGSLNPARCYSHKACRARNMIP